MSPAGVIIQTRRHLTALEAGDPPAPGQVWDEALQTWIPIGERIREDIRQRESDPAWLLAQYDRQRAALQAFVAGKLEEAAYDERGYPVSGKLRDYYTLPGWPGKALTKKGAEKLGNLFRYRVQGSPITHSVESPEYCSARVRVDVVDVRGFAMGSFEGSATSAEAGFQADGVRRKYGAPGTWQKQGGGRKVWVESGPPDYRAGLHDIAARARKRGFTGAVITACAAQEIFDLVLSTTSASAEDGRDQDDGRVRTSAAPNARTQAPREASPRQGRPAVPGGLTTMPIGERKGEPITAFSDEELARAATWCRSSRTKQDLAARFDEVLEERRIAREGAA